MTVLGVAYSKQADVRTSQAQVESTSGSSTVVHNGPAEVVVVVGDWVVVDKVVEDFVLDDVVVEL